MEVTAGSTSSKGSLKEKRSASVPVSLSIPSVAELPRSRPSSARLLYWVRISPFSWRTMLKSIRREMSLKKWTLAKLDHEPPVRCGSLHVGPDRRLLVDLEVVPVPVDGAVWPSRGRDPRVAGRAIRGRRSDELHEPVGAEVRPRIGLAVEHEGERQVDRSGVVVAGQRHDRVRPLGGASSSSHVYANSSLGGSVKSSVVGPDTTSSFVCVPVHP
jgi:hypothetical protein